MEYISTCHSEFCLAIIDCKMPQINGIELAKIISQLDDKIMVMLMSGCEIDRDLLRQINKEEYLKKPIQIAKLIEIVKKQLTTPSP